MSHARENAGRIRVKSALLDAAFGTAAPRAAERASMQGAPQRASLERDLRRAITVARQARLRDYRIEMAPDGTITIVVGSAAREKRRRT